MATKSLKKSLHITTHTTTKLIEELSLGVLSLLTGAATGVESALLTIGNMASGLGEDVKVISKTAAEGVGDVTQQVATGLGSIVKPIPIVGGPTAYLVKGAGTGIYYIVISVADVIGTVSTVAGKTVKATGKVLVFTLASGREVATNVVEKSNKLVDTVLGRVNKLGSNNNHSKKSTKKSSKSKKSKKH